MKKRIASLILSAALMLSPSASALVAEETPAAAVPQQDENGTYLIGSDAELYWFAEKVKTQTAADEEANESYTTGYLKRTEVNARLTADIDLNPGVSFAYDHSSGLVAISKGDTTLHMGTGMKGTLLGNFPVYNDICTLDEWEAKEKTDQERATIQAQYLAEMQTKLDALGLRKWTPIGSAEHPYVGTFDGDGHTIDGVYVNDDTVYNAGLFGYTSTFLHTGEYATRMPGEIKNLALGRNSLVVGYYADYYNAREPATGGIVGKMSFDKIVNCTNRATVVGKGSMATHNYGTGYVAGVVSILLGTAENCVNYGTIVSANSAGGVIGHLISSPNPNDDKSSIKNCTNYGSVYADIAISQSLAGGVVARDGGDEGGVGSPITSCVNRGYVEGSCAGGIVQIAGDGTAIKYCANFGEIKGMSSAAGLVDYIYRNGFDLQSSYNAGTVALLDRPEGISNPEFVYRQVFPLVSRIRVFNTVSDHIIKNCYNDETVCPAPDGKLFGENITNVTNCSSVSTDFFASGEPAYKMRSWENGSWMQDLSNPAETYPHAGREPRVYENTRWCCHTDNTNKEAHKRLFYSNKEENVTAEHTIGTNGFCSHCGVDCRAPILTTDTLLSATEGDWYSQTILTDSTAPQPTTFELVTSETDDTPFTLPAGLSAKSYDGTNSRVGISGTPDTGTAGAYTFTVKATNAYGTTKKTYTLTITENSAGEFRITTEVLPYGVVGEKYGADLSTNSDDPKLPVTWSVMKDTPLPDGIEFDGKSGALFGTPAKAGEYTLSIEAARFDSKEYAYATLTLTVYASDPRVVPETAEKQPDNTAKVRIDTNDPSGGPTDVTAVVYAVDLEETETPYVSYVLQAVPGYEVQNIYDIILMQGESAYTMGKGETAEITLTVGADNARNIADGKLVLIHLPENGEPVIYGVNKEYQQFKAIDTAAGTVTFETASCSPFLLAGLPQGGGDVVTVSGEVKGCNSTNAPVVTLRDSKDTVLNTATLGSAEKDGGQFKWTFSFSDVAAGTYDLVVAKDAHLTYTIKNVEVGGKDLDLTTHTNTNIKLITLLAGDVNGDGSINESDVSVIRQAGNINTPASDAGNPKTDVNGDGSINESDVSVVRQAAHINKGTDDCTHNFKED